VQTANDRADFFVLDSYNGSQLISSVTPTQTASRGMGPQFAVQRLDHMVPATEGTFHIRAVRHFAMPIMDMLHRSPSVEGDVRFTPKPNGIYVVEGSIERTTASVWIRDEATGEIVQRLDGR
jgi:hypothetical protein